MNMSELFAGISRGVPGVGPRQMTPPASSFEDPEKIAGAASLRYEPGRLFLGLLGAAIERDSRTGERFAQGGIEIGVADDRHAITIAGTRAGKGRAAIIPNMLRYSGSVLAIDPKGELALATAAVRARQLGQRVCVLDPFATTQGALGAFYKGFNPIAQMRPGSLIEDAGLIADALVVFETSGADPHWDESARSFIEGVILEVATAERFAGRRNLVTVRDLIAEGESFDLAAAGEDGESVRAAPCPGRVDCGVLPRRPQHANQGLAPVLCSRGSSVIIRPIIPFDWTLAPGAVRIIVSRELGLGARSLA